MKKLKKRMDKYKDKKKLKLIILCCTIFISISCYFYFESINLAIKAENVEKAPLSNVQPPKPVSKTEDIVITSVGDCTIGTDDRFSYSNSFPYVLKKNNSNYSYFFKNVADIFKKDDLTTANLETTFTNATKKAMKTYNFKSSPEFTQVLTTSGIEAVNISNNHIYDYLSQGYEDTKVALNSANIKYFGEGNIYITEIKGVKFGFLGYTGFSNSNAFLNKLKTDISSLKAQGCIVIINFHWGIEAEYNPNEVQKQIAHFAIDNGADMIIGHHPHVIQGIEQYKNKIICYSIGNFCFGGNTNPSDKDSFIVQAIFKTENSKLISYGIRIIPCSISSVSYTNDYCPTPMTGVKKENFLAKLNKLSPKAGFKISEEFFLLKQ